MSKIQDLKQSNASGWSFSFVQVGFWMSFCISVSFAAVYLQALGYSNAGALRSVQRKAIPFTMPQKE